MAHIRKLIGSINGKLITREFFPDYVGSEDRINCGNCYRWAYIAYMLYKDVELYSNDGHAFVEQHGMYYDSESPRGEKNLEDLNCNSMCGYSMYDTDEQNLEEFIDFWANNGTFRDKQKLDNQIRNFWRRHDRRQMNQKPNRRISCAA